MERSRAHNSCAPRSAEPSSVLAARRKSALSIGDSMSSESLNFKTLVRMLVSPMVKETNVVTDNKRNPHEEISPPTFDNSSEFAVQYVFRMPIAVTLNAESHK